ncbi:MAG: ATP-dependent zinc metalloprotease FtsH [Planctomycetes bacterium]|nr:ATP-dependent zinc metalloprotease FtsH [Planctomycetota bacterium]
MSEKQPTPDSDKSRRSRSFGSFLIVLVVLLLVLAVVGNDPFASKLELSQDQYEWYLNKGDVLVQEYKGSEAGTNLIKGRLRSPDKGEVTFEVRYASLKEREERFRDLKSRSYVTTRAAAFRHDVEQGRYVPIEARSLTANTTRRSKVPGEKGGAEKGTLVVDPEPESRLLVKATATPTSSVTREGGERLVPPPLRLGHVDLDVRLEPGDDLAALERMLEERGVPIERRTFDLSLEDAGGTRWDSNTSPFSSILFLLGPWVLLFVVFLIFMRQMRSQGGAGGVMSFGRSRAQLYSKESHTNTTFDDVAGADEAKDEVRELVEFLKNPGRFTRIGGRIPRGVLLVGPPGCGKTLLAKAIAGEAEVPFFSISGSDFVEMFVGVGASRVRDLFKQARENSPCIIFLDEIDAVGRRRGSGMGGGHDEREQTLNAILVEMDGFGTDEGIIVVAATNRPDVLDPALLRPGRFDREVTIDLPDMEGRRAILGVHLKRVKSGPDADVSGLARSTPGYSGADLAAIINEAAIMAVLAKRDMVSMADLEEARDKVRYGRQKRSRKIEEQDRRITAYHEAGHAVVAAALPETDSPHKVTIVPRGRALGATMIVPERESYHMQRAKLHAQIAMLFGGRVAEALYCGDISAGASDDIRRATDLARAMVAELGMSEKIGPINYAERQGSDFLGTEIGRGKIHSEETAREIDQEVMRFLTEAYQRAESILRANGRAVEEIAQALLLYETVNGEEVARILAGASAKGLRPEPDAEQKDAPKKSGTSERRAGEDRSKGLSGEPGLSPA